MSNRVFDILAYIQRIFLPAFAVLIVALGKIWNFESEALLISATIEAVDYFMGRVLKISSDRYFDALEHPPTGEQDNE